MSAAWDPIRGAEQRGQTAPRRSLMHSEALDSIARRGGTRNHEQDRMPSQPGASRCCLLDTLKAGGALKSTFMHHPMETGPC